VSKKAFTIRGDLGELTLRGLRAKYHLSESDLKSVQKALAKVVGAGMRRYKKAGKKPVSPVPAYSSAANSYGTAYGSRTPKTRVTKSRVTKARPSAKKAAAKKR
jgi:hypothetical protein